MLPPAICPTPPCDIRLDFFGRDGILFWEMESTMYWSILVVETEKSLNKGWIGLDSLKKHD